MSTGNGLLFQLADAASGTGGANPFQFQFILKGADALLGGGELGGGRVVLLVYRLFPTVVSLRDAAGGGAEGVPGSWNVIGCGEIVESVRGAWGARTPPEVVRGRDEFAGGSASETGRETENAPGALEQGVGAFQGGLTLDAVAGRICVQGVCALGGGAEISVLGGEGDGGSYVSAVC